MLLYNSLGTEHMTSVVYYLKLNFFSVLLCHILKEEIKKIHWDAIYLVILF